MNAFTGTGALLRLGLRRDRVLLPAWLAVLALMAWVSASATVDLYPSLSSRMAAAQAVNGSQALVALYGRVYDTSSIGAISMIKMGSLGAVFVAMLAVVVAVRHTRADEEAGRLELLGATAVGRLAPPAAALGIVLLADVALAVLTAGALTATGLPADGSAAFGLAWAGVGIVFGGIAVALAQLTTSARTAISLSALVLGVVYVLRALGDTAPATGPRWLTWLSPIGWGQQFRPYAGNRWWVLLITAGFAVVTAAAAFALVRDRDLGTGVLPTRDGPPRAAPSLRTPLALARRLHRGSLIGWTVGFVLVGAFLGNLATDIGGFFDSGNAREVFERLGGQKTLTDAFLTVELGFAGIVAAAYGIQAVLRLRSEELELRAEPVLATAVGRLRWALGHVAVAVVGTALLMVGVGAGAGLAYGAQAGDLGRAGSVLGAALAQLPAVWVLVAVAVAAFGVSPRLAPVGWAVLAAFVFLGELGPLLRLDHWVMDLSPFTHTPKLPGGAFSATPVLALTVVAVAIAAGGLVALRRRDIA